MSIILLMLFLERMRVSPGPLCPGDPDRDMLGDGTSMVCRSYSALHKSRELIEIGIRMRRAGRETAVFRCP